MDPVHHELGDGRLTRGDDRHTLGERLDQDVGQPVAVAVGGDLGREEEKVARSVLSADGGLIERPGPGDAARQAEGLDAGAEGGLEGAVAHDREPDRGLDTSDGIEQGRVSLLRLEAADDQQLDRIVGVGAVASRPEGRRRREQVGIEPMVDELHPSASERLEPVPAGRRAGHGEPRIGELRRELPVRSRPHVLRVAGEAVPEPRHDRRVAGDGRGRVKKVGVKVRRPGGEASGAAHQPDRSAGHGSAWDRARRRGARGRTLARSDAANGERPGVTRQHAARLFVQVLGQVRGRGPNRRMDRVGEGIVGATERHDVEWQAPSFERGQLVSDERLRDARIALEDDDGPSGSDRGPQRRGRRRSGQRASQV